MLQSQEIFLLASVPGEIAYPIAAAAGGAIATLYRNGRKDTIDAITAITHNSAVMDKLVEIIKELQARESKGPGERHGG
jgi:hypothetical protein